MELVCRVWTVNSYGLDVMAANDNFILLYLFVHVITS